MGSDQISQPADRVGVPVTSFEPADHDGAEPWRAAPVACTLHADEQADRATQWGALVAEAVSEEEIADGRRLTFPADAALAARIAGLAAAEQQCCAFFAFTLQLEPGAIVLTVRAPQAGAELLAALFGATA
jgi:hypothetical protein